MTRYICVIIKIQKKHSLKRFGITIPIAVAIDDAARSLYNSIDFGISGAFLAYIGEQYVIQNCGEEDLRDLRSWFVLQGCDILMVQSKLESDFSARF